MKARTSVTAGAVVCVGVFLVLLGADIIPQRAFALTVPGWMSVAIGVALFLAGASVFFRIGSPTATRLIGVCMLMMAVPFVWVAIVADVRHMSGGVPFLPDHYNRSLGRLMFGLGALFWLWLGVAALRHAKHQPERGVVESDQ